MKTTCSNCRSSRAVRPLLSVVAVSLLTLGAAGARGQSSTIDPAAPYAWGANIGWTNWRPSTADGVGIGEYVNSGFIYAANVGWINLGSGAPANGIQYANNSATDFGVNFLAGATPGVALLRGLAYGANIGWINFEHLGNAQLDLQTGKLSGYAWSANCGWINLGTGTLFAVKTLSITPGTDTDGDGIADAFELLNFGNLTTANATSDSDGDGASDKDEYLEGTDPKNPNDRLRVVSIAKSSSPAQDTASLVFTTNGLRFYKVETRTDLPTGGWTDSPLSTFVPDAGVTTSRNVTTGPAVGQRFYRVVAIRPLISP